MDSTKRPHTSALPVILLGDDALQSTITQICNASAHADVDAACAYPLFVPPHAYETFISHEPPPTDSWITVETTPGEHRLLVRLPGFQRNGITLTRRKHRVLHVVADLWCEPGEGGGHFERCISFGDDVHLAQVRAEFELGAGLLRIVIPRNMT
ncbi:hypothetical protein DFH08DRAFT_719983 [Mycena albidolilacea]|uniref:SHSP domain-containing protein n=1 Tax=Mycena albidolilacea TaxID=1033008 RepID=A0AAD6Z5B1_9AGAR|nr:hypothetical protein DFH08DRAFT_719983 [Mycena albidolilacea]